MCEGSAGCIDFGTPIEMSFWVAFLITGARGVAQDYSARRLRREWKDNVANSPARNGGI